MIDPTSLPKAFESASIEDSLYAAWEASGAFTPETLPDRNKAGEPYAIMMPPPNRTGTLHMGHATMLAIQDILIRFHRMLGERTLWVPGTDHAAIATQVKVEQLLIKEGMKDPRAELGREKFLERVVAFAEQSKNTINHQVRKMGSSCDWTRERYTLDEDRNRAVFTVFKMMFEDGLIERGHRIVNWDPQFQTTLSDDEVLTKDVKAKLYTFRYDASFPISISTTRPETKFGDTAVAVHPDDARYAAYVGQEFHPVFCGRTLTVRVVADAAVDPTFGTGALGVTPAHSLIDAEMAVRHALPTVQVVNEHARMMDGCGACTGLTTVEARDVIEQELRSAGLLVDVQEIDQALPVAERGGAVVEQLPSKQWFVRVTKPFALRQDTLSWKQGDMVTLKQLMHAAVADKHIAVIPERFADVYHHWIDGLRDWCISRQIWFGHRIPVWTRGDEVVVSDVSPGDGFEQDPDTLDTWFSSGMWTFSALGWPDAQAWKEHRAFHPTAVLETGRDILFFWVARMVLMSLYAIGEIPFKDVYLHGLITDEHGKKMSKSLGNILDPLELIPKYGTDAVRLSLVVGSSAGQDTKLSEAKIAGYRNFTNKLWNISRFILMQLAETTGTSVTTNTDRWMLSRLKDVATSVTHKLTTYQLSSAGEELRDFTWGELADWYLEIKKVEGANQDVLRTVLRTVLTLWHPFMPFVTEHVWELAGFDGKLILAPWPVLTSVQADQQAVDELVTVQRLVTDFRRLRMEAGIAPVDRVAFALVGNGSENTVLATHAAAIRSLIRAEDVCVVEDVPEGWVTTLSGTRTIALDRAGSVDVEAEQAKRAKQREETSAYIASLEQKLANTEFTSKAPARVTDEMKQKLADAREKLEQLR